MQTKTHKKDSTVNKLLQIFYGLAHLLDRLQPPGTLVMGSIAILVGLVSGTGVWLFKLLIELARSIMFEGIGGTLEQWGGWTVAVVPVLGGLIVGQLVFRFIGEERHHGVAGIIESVALAGGRLRYWRIPAKALAAAVSIGSGASVGPEDPSVQIGSNIGSMTGQLFHFSDERTRALVAAGAAAGIAAAFNAPIAGVFFALELILGGVITSGALGAILLAAVSSSVFTQAVEGPQPAFGVPAYAFHSVWELPLYLLLGLVAGPISALYIRMIYWTHDFFHGWQVPKPLKPAAAGLMVGLAGIFLPQIMGEGYTTIETILVGQQLALGLLLTLLLAKLVFTAISVSGGFIGGVFAPALFLGAVLGSMLGMLADIVFPHLVVAPAAFAMVGMAAVLAGTVHAPLTAILLLFEMTNDYRIILPLMFAVSVSMLTSQLLQRDSVYQLGLVRKGIRLEHGRDVEVLEGITVSEVMDTDYVPLHENDSLHYAATTLMETHSHGLVVLNDRQELVGVLALQDIDRFQTEPDQDTITVGEACTRNLLVAYPDETLGAALRRMSVRDIGRLPVVAHDNKKNLLGLLRRSHVIRAYDVALVRRAAQRHRMQQVRLGAVSDVDIEEVKVSEGARCVGRHISDIQWPRECTIATLRRGAKMVIPHGDTVLYPGDVLVVVGDSTAINTVKEICTSPY